MIQLLFILLINLQYLILHIINEDNGYLKKDLKKEEEKKGIKGNKFDSSIDRGKPFECKIGVGQLIRGILYKT